MAWLGPLRSAPERFYARSDSDQAMGLGARGEHVAMHLFDNQTEVTVVNEWFEKLDIPYELRVVPVFAGARSLCPVSPIGRAGSSKSTRRCASAVWRAGCCRARSQLAGSCSLVRSQFPDAEHRIRSWPLGEKHSLLDICDAYAACWSALRWALTDGGELKRRDDVTPPLELLGETAPGEPAREPASGLAMRMVV